VNDFAHVIPASNAATIERIISDVRAKSGGEIVVVTLPDLNGRPIEDVSLAIGREWKVGKKGNPGDTARNTGVIILVVPKETSRDGRGHARIEVGYGAEGFITDSRAGAIRDEAIPLFQNRDYGKGIELMTARVAERYASNFGFQLDSTTQIAMPPPRPVGAQTRRGGGGPPIFFYLFILFIILSALGGGRRGCGGGGCLPLLLMSSMGGLGGGCWGGGGVWWWWWRLRRIWRRRRFRRRRL
jgi:uncharacterized protein